MLVSPQKFPRFWDLGCEHALPQKWIQCRWDEQQGRVQQVVLALCVESYAIYHV